jgi:nicotinate-nucleotide adenylyltransferase
LRELHTWYQPAEILRHCRIVTAARPGYESGDLSELEKILPTDTVASLRGDVLATPRIDISATEIRRRTARAQSIRYFTPEAVIGYIGTHGLYRT